MCFLVLRGSLKTFGNFEHVSLFPCVVVCCSVLQCVAVCCSALQCVAVSLISGICSKSCCFPVLQCVAVFSSVLQCVAVCCIVLHCVVVYCSELQ